MIYTRLILTSMIVLAAPGLARGDEPAARKGAARILEGRVVDDHGVPIADAMVLLRPATDSPRFTLEGAARTDASGRFRLDLTKTDWGGSRLQCMLLATGFAYAIESIDAGSATAVTDFTLKPEPWKTTEIRLADPSGKPGAGVEFGVSVATRIPWSRIKTDSEGRCRIAMAIGQPLHLEATPTGARRIEFNFVNAKDDPATITLPLLAPIRGRVHDAQGRPLPQVTVGRLIAVRDGRPRMLPHFRSTATTDDEGRFELASTVLVRDRYIDRPDGYRYPTTICFADREFHRIAFRLADLTGPIEPLDVTLESSRVVRVPIESDSTYSSSAARAGLAFSVVPRPDMPSFNVRVFSIQLSSGDLTTGKPIEVRVPEGKYLLSLQCYNDVKSLGTAEREVVVTKGERPLDLAPLHTELTPHQKMAGNPAPDIEAIDRDTGKPVRLADFRGKVIVLDFWGYWCGPCLGAMPFLAELHRRFEGKPLAVVALHDQSVQSRADYDRRIAFSKKWWWNGQDLPFRILLDRPDPRKPADRDPEGTGATCQKYQIEGFPTLFVIDQQGIVANTVPFNDHNRLEALVRSLLDKPTQRRPDQR